MKEDKIIKDWLKQLPEKEPSAKFTDNIMAQIKPLPHTLYRPLISKKMWAIIVLSFTSLATLLRFQEGYRSKLELPDISLPSFKINSFLQLLNFGSFTSPVISLSIAAVLLLWTLLMLSQGIKIQQMFNKRYIF